MADASTPKGLAAAGSALWLRISVAYVMREDEVTVLEQAARVADVIAKLDAALVNAPLTVLGSAGQLREHPLLAEARQQRVLLARLLVQLKLPEADEVTSRRAAERSDKARKAARARWGGGGRGATA